MFVYLLSRVYQNTHTQSLKTEQVPVTVSYIAYSYLRNYLLLFTVSVHPGGRGKGGVWVGGRGERTY